MATSDLGTRLLRAAVLSDESRGGLMAEAAAEIERLTKREADLLTEIRRLQGFLTAFGKPPIVARHGKEPK